MRLHHYISKCIISSTRAEAAEAVLASRVTVSSYYSPIISPGKVHMSQSCYADAGIVQLFSTVVYKLWWQTVGGLSLGLGLRRFVDDDNRVAMTHYRLMAQLH